MSARLLARTGAVLARIDQTLDDPFPAAVARLMGPLDQPAPVGDECWGAVDYRAALLLEYPSATLSPDTPVVVECGYPATTDIGLCDRCHAEIATGEPAPDRRAGDRIPGLLDRIAESLPPLVSTAPPMSPIAARQAVTEYMSAVLAHLQENPTT